MQSFKSYLADTGQILITDGRTHGRTDERTHEARTLYAPPPFFEWRGHKYGYSQEVWVQLNTSNHNFLGMFLILQIRSLKHALVCFVVDESKQHSFCYDGTVFP